MTKSKMKKQSLAEWASKTTKAAGAELGEGVDAAKAAGARSSQVMRDGANAVGEDVREASTRATEAVRGAANVVHDDAEDVAEAARERGTSIRRALVRGARDLRRTLRRSLARLRTARSGSLLRRSERGAK